MRRSSSGRSTRGQAGVQPVGERGDPDKGDDGAILTKAVREARGLAIEAAIYEKDVVDAIIGKAYREGQAIKSLVK